MAEHQQIYIATVLLERNRWTREKIPTFKVSNWMSRFMADGFSGVELWANHAEGGGEIELLEAASLPIPVLNAYDDFDVRDEESWKQTGELIRRFGSNRVKFNVGSNPELWKTYLDNVRFWRAQLPDGVTILCECHPGTVIEKPHAAHRFFDELGDNCYEILVHPFSGLEFLPEWFEVFGSKITHAHLQMRDEVGRWVRFERFPERVREAVRIMKEFSFQGSYTLEFTEGTGLPGEDIETLYAHAQRDFNYLSTTFGVLNEPL